MHSCGTARTVASKVLPVVVASKFVVTTTKVAARVWFQGWYGGARGELRRGLPPGFWPRFNGIRPAARGTERPLGRLGIFVWEFLSQFLIGNFFFCAEFGVGIFFG